MCDFDLHSDVVDILKRRFEIKEIIGQGTFGKVYLAIHRFSKKKMAIKYLKPTCKIIFTQTEIQLLNECCSNQNIIDILDVIKIKEHILIVMPYFKHTPITNFMDFMSIQEIASYIYNLLFALSGVHDKNIIHRDIKPTNFLYNRAKGRYMLVDFGLAHKTMNTDADICLVSRDDCIQSNITGKTKFNVKSPKNGGKEEKSKKVLPKRTCLCEGHRIICELCMKRPGEKAKRSGTPGYRAPEILMKCDMQTRAIDVWSVGSIFLSILSGCKPYFKPAEDLYVFAELINIFGSKRMIAAAANIGKELLTDYSKPQDLRKLCESIRKEKEIPEIKMLLEEAKVEKENSLQVAADEEKDADLDADLDLTVPEDILNHAYSLLDSLLDPNYSSRITSEHALNHPFFSHFK